MCHSTSMFLALVIGWYLFLTSLGMLIHQAHYKKVIGEYLGNHSILLLSGALGVIFGLLIVLSHNIWVSDWPILITIVGWLTLLQGTARVIFPDAAVKFAKEVQAKVGFTLMSWVWLLIGVYLIWVGHSMAMA